MARELGVRLDEMDLQVGASVATGIIDRQGLVSLRHLGLSHMWLQAAVLGKRITLKDVHSESTWQITEQRHSSEKPSIDKYQHCGMTSLVLFHRTNLAHVVISRLAVCSKDSVQFSVQGLKERAVLSVCDTSTQWSSNCSHPRLDSVLF